VCDLKQLERLELGYNEIKRIEGLRGLAGLTHLVRFSQRAPHPPPTCLLMLI
jgi:hypothetical protein